MHNFIRTYKFALLLLLFLIIASWYLWNTDQNTSHQINSKSDTSTTLHTNTPVNIDLIEFHSTDTLPTILQQESLLIEPETPEYTEQIPPKTDKNEHEVEAINYLATTTISMYVDGQRYYLDDSKTISLYDAMQTLEAYTDFSFSTIEYGGSLGTFVNALNGIENNKKERKYWIYYINNKPATAGISNYIIQQGDKIEWKYETSSF